MSSRHINEAAEIKQNPRSNAYLTSKKVLMVSGLLLVTGALSGCSLDFLGIPIDLGCFGLADRICN